MDENRLNALKEIESGEPLRIVEALISLAFYDEDWEFVENVCIK